jgi:hypothetical protein
MAFPDFAEYFRAERFGDFVRAIVHVMVEDDDDFARPIRYAFQSGRNPVSLIAGDDADGNG